MSSSMSWNVFASAIVDARLGEEVTTGIKAFVRLYFDDYTDAVEIDRQTSGALEVVYANSSVVDVYLDELIAEVQAEITAETGRVFTTSD